MYKEESLPVILVLLLFPNPKPLKVRLDHSYEGYYNSSQWIMPLCIQPLSSPPTSSHCCRVDHDLLWLMEHLQTWCKHKLKKCLECASPVLLLFGTLNFHVKNPGPAHWRMRHHVDPEEVAQLSPIDQPLWRTMPGEPPSWCRESWETINLCFKPLHFEVGFYAVIDTMALRIINGV